MTDRHPRTIRLTITTSDSAAGTVTKAARLNAATMLLMNGKQLITLLVEYGMDLIDQTHTQIVLGAVDTVRALLTGRSAV